MLSLEDFSFLWDTCDIIKSSVFFFKIIQLVLFVWNYKFLMKKKYSRYATVSIYSSEEYKDDVLKKRKDLNTIENKCFS